MSFALRRRDLGIAALLGAPVLLCALAILVPLVLTLIVSFWERQMIGMKPGFSLGAYALFFEGVRFSVLKRSFFVATSSTVLMLAIAYVAAYIVTFRLTPRWARIFLFLLSVPFLVNYVIRTFSFAYLLGRSGPINRLLQWLDLTSEPLDWLLFGDFSVYLGLVAAYMPFMVYPIWLSLAAIDKRLIEASWTLGEPPSRTFLRVVLPLSLPGVFAAAIFGFVGAFGEVAVSQILGGVGYQLMGNAITSALDVLNYPMAAAMSTVVVGCMLLLLLIWLRFFDLRLFLGKMLGR
ncbi:putative spermidine/putrescine transport system permease protein/spermidine/putrescine transport system permease protein [Rhizobiales bacterium GAS191]|jgi:ABC-type spermidine/putrescine transport system permease subunit I|nr:putative spermidine/putrescine transport system permease protein/spermidine/putrescine transport system permease protein [Rhizobiales bacterium GAS113]SED72914.1 putative spermidine/putrescine transport system permease protein/spermidine/putrescine transport system permease protein [Rhizobiales bacterium GAS188]SEE80743.1 putative spermidine/putrescine transport system permease protein/spermidine/putrescine transport system permease protein [Rhizobiales bacterium GAS191]